MIMDSYIRTCLQPKGIAHATVDVHTALCCLSTPQLSCQDQKPKQDLLQGATQNCTCLISQGDSMCLILNEGTN